MLPPGTETYKLEIAPSGHLVLPCCEYQAKSAASSSPPPTVVLQLSQQETATKGGKKGSVPSSTVSRGEAREFWARQERIRRSEDAYGRGGTRPLPPPPKESPRLGMLRMEEEPLAPQASPPGLSRS